LSSGSARRPAAALRAWLAHPLTRGLALDDPGTTALRGEIVRSKPFLRKVYEDWYRSLAGAIPAGEGAVLELGSGGGFLGDFVPGLITSDVFPCPGVERVIDAREAERIGLVNEVVDSGTCLRRAVELAEAVAALPQPALRTDLQAARTGQGRPLDEGLRIEAQCFTRSIFASETFEGLRQFNERDHPDRRADTAPVTPGLARSL